MTGPRPAGDAWTADDDRKLMAMFDAKTDVATTARKLKRSVGAVQSRRSKLRRLARSNVPETFEPSGIGLNGSS
jgi:hypothetical protein